jgi:NAD(P)-dependent dehydrogenase (short-subunit alcohol dehydrogenase family)
MPKELAGQVALITGGGRGFGKSIAMRFAAEGAAVAVTSRTQAELDQTVSEIQSAGGRGLAIKGDVTKPEDVARVVRTTTEHLGPLDLFVNNAGIPGPFAPIWVADPAEWWFAQEVHLRAFFMFIREILPSMIQRRAGRILAVSAIASYRVDFAMSAYCVGKTSQNRLVQFVAFEAREYGVSAFAIDPGFVATELAEETMRDPGAQRWKPEMIEHLKARKADPNSLLDLQRCAQRCVDLASGRYDELSGSYFELKDNLDEMLREAREAGQNGKFYITSHWRTA